MSYLIKTTEEHRVSSEAEAAKLIEEAKNDNRFMLLKSSTTYKNIKEKKEIVEEYWICTLVKQFTDAKYPDCTVSVSYNVDNGIFPTPLVKEISESSYNEGYDDYDDDDEGEF